MSAINADLRHRKAVGGWAEDALSTRTAWPIAPWNTWSNAAYVLVGIALGQTAPVVAIALGYLGFASGWYHGKPAPIERTRDANRLDRSGMGAVFGALLAYGLGAPVPVQLVAAVVPAWIAARIGLKQSMTLLMAQLLWAPVLLGFLVGSAWWTGASLLLFALAYVAWHLDRARSRLVGRWGHALWHVLTAAAIGGLVLALIP